jgi:hypothetical protein
MNILKSLLLVAVLLPIRATAQKNFKPGYIVTFKNDTISGDIDYKQWNNNPIAIRFKNQAGQITSYTAKNIAAFGVKSYVYYDRFIVSITTDEVNIKSLSNGLDTTKYIDTVFLKKVATGKYLSLYTYTDKIKTRYLAWDKSSQGAVELEYHEYTDLQTGKISILEKYKNQLTAYALNFGKFTAEFGGIIRSARYDEELIAIVNTINGVNPENAFRENRGGHRFFIGVVYNNSSFNYSGNINLAQNQHNKSFGYPELNVGIDLFTNKDVAKLILRQEINYWMANFKVNTSASNTSSQLDQDIQQSTIGINSQIIYNFYNTENFKVYLGAGIRFNISSYPKNSYAVDGIILNSTNGKPLHPLATTWAQVPFKAGIVINKQFELYGRYHFSTSLTNATGVSSELSNIGLGLNYLLR